MTVSSTTNRVSYTGNGAVDTYAYTFRIFANTDLLVTVRDTDDAETTLALTTDYTVTGVGALSGGNVVLVDADQAWLDADGDLKSGYVLTIRRVRPLKQETDIRNQGEFFPETHEDEFDRGVMVAQQQQDEIDRSVKLPETIPASDFDPTLPSDMLDSADKVPLVNATGDGWADVADWPSGDAIADAEANATAAAASAAAAATSETNAATSATSAATSATAAQTAASSVMWNDVVFITQADSPYSITSAHRGKLVCVNATGGAVTINLPQISGLTLSTPYVVGIKKTDSSGNAITVARAGTDTIDGLTSKTILAADSGAAFVPDTDPSPDEWTTAEFGAQAGNLTVDTFSGDGSDTTFDLSVEPGTENNTWVFISGVYQQKDTYSLSGTTLTFSAAPPVGTNNIQVISGTTLSIGTPSDGTVTTAKIVDANVTKAKLADTALYADVVSTTTTPYSVAASDDVILMDATAGAKTINLPAAASHTGRLLRVKKTDSSTNAVTLDGNASETIDGSATVAINRQNEEILIVSDGTNWRILQRFIAVTGTNDGAPTGYVGEVIESQITSSTNFPASGTIGDLTSISLTAGHWLVSVQLEGQDNGATCTQVQAGVSTTSGNSAAGWTVGINRLRQVGPTATAASSITIANYEVKLTATTTHYLKYIATYSAGTPQAVGRITAVRIR